MVVDTDAPRVLMLSDVYFPRVNGVSTSIQTFRRDLARMGWPVQLIAPLYPAPWPDDPLTTRVRSRAVPLDPEDCLMSLRELRRAAKQFIDRVELIHIQTPFAAHRVGTALARAHGIRTVETYHTYFEQYFHHYAPFIPQKLSRAVARQISRMQCNGVDAVIAPSQPMADVLRSYGVRSTIEVISTGLDLARFERGDGAAFRRKLGIGADRRVLLYVGRVAFEKNIEFLIDMFARVHAGMPEAMLVIAGEGPAREALTARVRKLNLEADVRFVGYLERDAALLDCYRSADVFVFASSTETQGLVLLEAMAVGTPVVSTAVLGTKDVLEKGQSGAIVTPEDHEAFSAAVVRVLRDERLRDELSEHGRRYVRMHWSSETMAARTVALYEHVSGRGRNAAVRATTTISEPRRLI